MGSSPSVDLFTQSHLQNSYFSMQMSYSNRLWLIFAPDEIIYAAHTVLSQTWQQRIDMKKSPGFVEFKIKGDPWYQRGEKNFIVKNLICSLLEKFYELGWHFKTATNMLKSISETNVLFFQKQKPVITKTICISMDSNDLIRVLGNGDKNINQIIREAILNNWSPGIQKEKSVEKLYEIKLKNFSWYESIGEIKNSNSLDIVGMFCEIMRTLSRLGWNFIGAIKSEKLEKAINALYFNYVPTEIDENYSDFFAVSLYKTNRLRLHNVNFDLVENLQKTWRTNMQLEKKINDFFEFKLDGNPWLSSGQEAIDSRHILNDLFNLLAQNGWSIYATCALSKRQTSKSAFFFQLKPKEAKISENFCLSINSCNKLRLIDRKNDMDLVKEIKSAVENGWPKGIKNLSDFYDSYQFELNDSPFSCFGPDQIYTCAMMTLILNNIESRGHRLLCSADISGKYELELIIKSDIYPVGLHSWFFES